jgi:exonuclease III
MRSKGKKNRQTQNLAQIHIAYLNINGRWKTFNTEIKPVILRKRCDIVCLTEMFIHEGKDPPTVPGYKGLHVYPGTTKNEAAVSPS